MSIEFFLSKWITLPLLILTISKLFKQSIRPSSKSSTQASSPPQEPVLTIPPVSSDFEWNEQKPTQHRPYKRGEYKLVMGIQNIPIEEWLLVEDTYKTYTDLRSRYLHDEEIAPHLLHLSDKCHDSLCEFYVMSTSFMLQRYPMHFEIINDQIHNKIRNEYIPLDPKLVKDKLQLVKYLASLLEEDFIIMFPDETSDEYIFQGGFVGFPSGFDPLIKFGKPLTSIHEPVPEYRTKLRLQMNKFFNKIKPYQFVKRHNWSIQLNNRLLAIGNEKGQEDESLLIKDAENLDFEKEVFFRTERQILTRLPQTGAVAFTIRTYVYSLYELRKEEDHIDELIEAIKGMKGPIGHYKRQPEWSSAVISYLKHETDGCEKPWIVGMS